MSGLNTQSLCTMVLVVMAVSRAMDAEQSSALSSASSTASFAISSRYPLGDRGSTPSLRLSPGSSTRFWCHAPNWHVCRWKRPGSSEACGMFSDDLGLKSCPTWLSASTAAKPWTVSVEDGRCVLRGEIQSEGDWGTWNCELQSKPIEESGDVYESDQEYFTLLAVVPAKVRVDMEPEIALTEDEELVIKVTLEQPDAVPQPQLVWFVNHEEIELPVLERVANTISYVYKARLSDGGKRLRLRVRQVDDEKNLVQSRHESFLIIRQIEQPQPLQSNSIAQLLIVIAVIFVVVSVILITAIVFVCSRRRREDRQPPIIKHMRNAHTSATVDNNEMAVETNDNEMAVQSNEINVSNEMNDLGKEETRRLLNSSKMGSLDSLLTHFNFAADEIIDFRDEGSGSLAGSLPSLNIEVNELQRTLVSLGQDFDQVANLVFTNEHDDQMNEDDDH